jgi:uncharacterized protein
MPEYLAPGVYVEEVDTGSKPIEGVSTTTSGMVGVTAWGPVSIPTLVTSFSDFQRQFGGYLDYRKYRDTWHLPHAVEGFFTNGGKRLYIVRVLPPETTFARFPLTLSPISAVALGNWAIGATAAAGAKTLTLNNVTNLTPGMWLQINSATATEIEFVYVTAVKTTIPTQITIDTPLRFAHASGTVIAEVSALILQAIDPGEWGDGLQVTVKEDNLVDTSLTSAAAISATILTLQSLVGIEVGSAIEVNYTVGSTPASGQFYKVTALNPLNKTVTIIPALTVAVDPTTNALVRSREFSLRVDLIQINPMTNRSRTIASETHRNLATDPRHSRYMVKVIGSIPTADTPLRADGRTDGESDLIRSAEGLTPDHAKGAIRTGPSAISSSLSGGNDLEGGINDATYRGEDEVNPQSRTGLFALKNIDEISIVAIPGRTSQTIQENLINHCELMRYRFAVLDSEIDSKMAEIQQQRGLYDSKYAAIYHPWLRINDPFPENPRVTSLVSIPPSGHIIGIYARSDIERGVSKAPANEVIRGIADLEVKLMKEQQDILNPRNINVLRNFREDNRGLRVWGARTLSSDPDWKYINVRRLFIFIEKSIDRGTQWVVFEPNDEPLWKRVKQVITAFLNQVWRNGALMGRTPEQAFFVKCDRSTMTQNDIDNGRLIVLIGIAPVKPAEFVIFRIGQWTGGSIQEEG